MKRMRQLLTLCLVLCLTLTVLAPTASAFTPQETAWLEVLRPPLPRVEGGTSYPAYLTVTLPEGGYGELHGTCSLTGAISDEEILEILRKAAPAVPGYKTPQDAMNDRLLTAAIKEKLQADKEDMDRLIENWINLLGLDKVARIFQLDLANYFGESDGVSAIGDIILSGGNLTGKDVLGAVSPVPLSFASFAQGVVINGVFVSWEEFKRDKDKYRDIALMAEANGRLRTFYTRVNELLREAMSNDMTWHIRIDNRQYIKALYSRAPEYYASARLDADIELVKHDDSYTDVVGTYTGRFKVSYEYDLSDYDWNYAKRLAEWLNGDGSLKLNDGTAYTSTVLKWTADSNTINRPSEERLTLEKSDVAVTLSLPAGVQRTRFEIPLSATALEQTEFALVEDRVSVARGVDATGSITETYTSTIIRDHETGTNYDQTVETRVTVLGEEEPIVNTDDGQLPRDMRPYIQMTLVVDTTGG